MQDKQIRKIISKENSRIKFLEKLNSKKERRDSGYFVVENYAIINDALQGGHDFAELYFTESFVQKYPERIDQLRAESQAQNFYLLDDKLNKVFSSLETPSGLAALYPIQAAKLDKGSVIYLNGISDPGNLGTIMRSALAFDFVNLVLDGQCADAFNPKTVSAAKDAIFKLNILEDRKGCWLKDNQLPLYAADAHVGTALEEFKAAKNFCLVLGSESHGVAADILQRADSCIRIAISNRIESLNVAAAAAILFYGLRR